MSRKILDMRDIRCPKCEELIRCGSGFDEKTGRLKDERRDGSTFKNYCNPCDVSFIVRVEIIPFYFSEETNT